MKRIFRLFLALACLSLLASGASAGQGDGKISRRVALVIGNSLYSKLPALPNPANDVAKVAATLKEAGFDVTVGVNVDRIKLEDTVRTFLRSAHDAEVGLIYYSGHGVQVAGENFLVPVDATLETPYDIETQTMPLDLIFNHLRQNTRVQLIFLDACRNNPFNTQKVWMAQKLEPVGATRGLARIDSNLGSLIAYSTEPGQVALDGTGTLSPYSQSFIKRASEPAKEIRQVLTDVRRDVIAATDGKQIPWENSSLTESFFFRPAPPPPTVEPMQQVNVKAGAAGQSLSIAPPRDEAGADLTVTLNQIPQAGKLIMDGAEVAQGAKLPASSLAKLSYDASGVNAGTIGLIGYTVSDPYGQTSQGVVALTVAENAEAKLAEAKKVEEQKRQDASAYLQSLAREVAATIGTGPVAVALPPVPKTNSDLTLKVTTLPEKGVLRAGNRVLTLGHSVEATDVSQLTYEPQIGTEGQSLPLTLKAGDDLPAVTITFRPLLDPCDSAAAAPIDLQGVTAGRLPNEIDPKQAIPACEKAVKTYPQVARFLYQLGRAQLADRKSKAAVKSFTKAMQAGHVRAIEQLGSLYGLGAIGPRDAAKSAETVAKGAEKGDPYALYAFGKDLYYGLGVKADTERGLKLMLKAADLGHTYAMNELGYIFLNGINIAADPKRAIAFYEAGVARNDIYSLNNLAIAYRTGKGVEKDAGKALELFKRAAEGGQPYAPTNLGRMYRDGEGVQKDAAQAAKWLETGAERGDYWGALDRARLALSGDGQTDKVTAVRYLALAGALNMPGNGDADNQYAKDLAALPSDAKKQAEALLAAELTAKERKALPRAASQDQRLVELARAGWTKRNPRYDLF